LSALISSFVPFISTHLISQYGEHYVETGAVDGAVICALTLTVEAELVAGVALIGAGYGVAYQMMV
jgi:hypothetical protein